eukprot:5560954-Pyramimonas_sp.AAC.2
MVYECRLSTVELKSKAFLVVDSGAWWLDMSTHSACFESSIVGCNMACERIKKSSATFQRYARRHFSRSECAAVTKSGSSDKT